MSSLVGIRLPLQDLGKISCRVHLPFVSAIFQWSDPVIGAFLSVTVKFHVQCKKMLLTRHFLLCCRKVFLLVRNWTTTCHILKWILVTMVDNLLPGIVVTLIFIVLKFWRSQQRDLSLKSISALSAWPAYSRFWHTWTTWCKRNKSRYWVVLYGKYFCAGNWTLVS